MTEHGVSNVEVFKDAAGEAVDVEPTAEEDVPEREAARAEYREMTHAGEVAVREGAMPAEMTTEQLVGRLEKLQDAASKALTDGVDYGTIPGVEKPSLFKPGAEKLCMLFMLDPETDVEERYYPDGHLSVLARTTIYHAPTGVRLGTGVGSCTTRETRYAFRQAQRECPECGRETVFKSKKNAGEWFCWAKKGGCGANFDAGSEQALALAEVDVGRKARPVEELADFYNCVTPETRVLTRDLCWVPAGELRTGDVLVSISEENRDQYGRPYEDAVVTVGDRFTDDLYELSTEDGRVVRCNGEHRWLVRTARPASGVEWVSTRAIHENMKAHRGRPRRWRVLSMSTPWEQEDSVEAGYVAGLLDADGSLDVTMTNGYRWIGVSFAQQANGVLERLTTGLAARQFEYGEYPHGNLLTREPVVSVKVRGGLFEQMRLLGTIRPPRLLERWSNLVDLSQRRFEGKAISIETVDRIGRGELVRLGTSSHTYFAEGLACHNTVLKMSRKRSLVDAVLVTTGASHIYTQDVEDVTPAVAEAVRSDPAADGFPVPRTWPKVKEAIVVGYGAGEHVYADFEAFIAAAAAHLYGEPSLRKLATEQRQVMLQKAAVTLVYVRDHCGDEIAGPSLELMREAWAHVLEGHELPLPGVGNAGAGADDVPFGES